MPLVRNYTPFPIILAIIAVGKGGLRVMGVVELALLLTDYSICERVS